MEASIPICSCHFAMRRVSGFLCRTAVQHAASELTKAFPQARWNLSLTIPEELTAIANMPEISATPAGMPGMVRRQYEMSPPFSTYLVAWVIGNMSHVEGSVPSPYPGQPARPVRIFATPQK